MTNPSSAGKTVTAYFSRRSDAEDAIDALKDAGFNQSQISLAVRPGYGPGEATDSSPYATGKKAGEKTEGAWHKVVGFFEGKSNDKNVSGASSAPSNSETYGSSGRYDYTDDEFQGSLTQMNVPEQHARYFSHRFSQGEEGAVVTVSAAGRENEAERILESYNGDVGRNAASFQYPPETGSSARQQIQNVQLLGEILRVHKDRVSRGEVVLRKDVIIEKQTIEVPVEREELVVTRKAVSGEQSADAGGEIGKNSEIRIPLSEEHVSVDKQKIVREEVSVGKRSVTGSETVSDNVRHEELNVDEGDVDRSENRGRKIA